MILKPRMIPKPRTTGNQGSSKNVIVPTQTHPNPPIWRRCHLSVATRVPKEGTQLQERYCPPPTPPQPPRVWRRCHAECSSTDLGCRVMRILVRNRRNMVAESDFIPRRRSCPEKRRLIRNVLEPLVIHQRFLSAATSSIKSFSQSSSHQTRVSFSNPWYRPFMSYCHWIVLKFSAMERLCTAVAEHPDLLSLAHREAKSMKSSNSWRSLVAGVSERHVKPEFICQRMLEGLSNLSMQNLEFRMTWLKAVMIAVFKGWSHSWIEVGALAW